MIMSSSMEFHGIPWNLKCANFADTSILHGTPWNLECANFADTSSSMEFHGTWSAPISMARAVSWNSMELVVRQFRWHEQFHGIPWNLECANFNDTSSSMEFHGIPWNLKCANFADTSSSMEFHGIWGVPISMTYIYIYIYMNILLPVRRQAIILTNAGLLSIVSLGTSFNEILI